MTDTNSIFYRIGQSVKSTMNSQLDDYVPFSGTQSIDLSGSGNFGSLSVSGVPVVTGSIDTSNFALLNHDHDTDYASISHSHSLYELDDVNIGATIDGQVLQWNDPSSAWEAATLDFASTDHVHSEYLDDSDLTAYSVTASAAVNGVIPSPPAGYGGEYHTAMTADNQFIAISYTDDNGSETVGKVDIFKRNSDGTLGDRFSVDLGAASAALPIAIARLTNSTFDAFANSGLAEAGTDGGLILYKVLSYDGSSGQLAKAHYISLLGDEIYGSGATDLGFITASSFTERAHSISITEDGEKVALGCFESDSGNPSAGRVFVYKLDLVPTPNFIEIRDYQGSTPDGAFGTSLSYSADGEMLAVGAPGNPTTAGAVIVLDDNDANYNDEVLQNPYQNAAKYERRFSLAIFSSALSWQDYPESENFDFFQITDLPVNDFFGIPVLKFDGTETHLSIVTAAQGKVYSFSDQGTGSWTAKGTPFTSTVEGSNAYSIDSSEDGNTIVVAYSVFSSLSEFDFTGHQIKRFVYDGTNWDSGTIVASISDADASYNKFKSVLIASDGSFITTAMSYSIAQAGNTDGLFRVYEYQNVYATREHNHTLSSLSDINHLNLSGGVPTYDGSMLIWDAFSGKWAATPNFLGNKNLNELDDVGGYTNASLTGGEILQWNASTMQFEAMQFEAGDQSSVSSEFVNTHSLILRDADMSGQSGTITSTASAIKIVPYGGTVEIGDSSNMWIPDANLNVNGNVTIGGSLTVNGTATTVNTTNLDVEDNIIKLNLNGGGNFVPGGIGGSSGIEIEAGQAAADGGNDRKARFVYNSGDETSAGYGTEPGFFEAIYEEDDVANPGSPLSGHLKMKVKGLEVERTSDATASAADVASGEVSDQPGFDNLGNFQDFMSGLNA